MIHDVTIFLRKKAQQDFLTEIMLTQDNPALHHGNQPIFLRLRMPEWGEKNNVKCQVELYESSEQRYADMNSGKLDAIVSTTVAEKEISKYLWNSIVKIGYSPYYFAVSKKSPELYDEMETALLQGEVDTIFPVYGSYWIAEDYANQ